MRLAFWRAGKDKAQAGAAGRRNARARPPKPGAYKPAVASEPAIWICARSVRRCCASGAGSSFRRCWPLVLSIAAVNLVTPRYKSEARILIDGRENVFLRPNGERNEERNRARRRGRHQPGPAPAVARSRARDHQEEQACRTAGIRSGAAGPVTAEIAAGAVRHRPRSILADAGRARAGCLLRALHRLCGRQIPRHRHRIPVARSGTGGACRQFDRRRLSRAAAGRAAGAGQIRQPVAVGRDRQSAQEGRGSRIARRGFPLEVEPVRRHQQHHAVQPADGRDSTRS